MAAPDPQTLVFTLNGADALLPAAPDPSDRQAAAPGERGRVRRRVHQAGQPRHQRRLYARELRAERQDRAEEEPQLLRRRQRHDRRGAVAAVRGPLGVPAPLRGGRGADLRRRPGRADGLHEGEAAGAAPDRALSRRLLPAGEDDQGEVRRPAGAPGDLDADRPRLHRRRGLAGHHAAGLLAGAAGDRQLRREPADARLCRRRSARPRGQGARALQGGGRRSGDAGDPAQLQLVGEPPQHHGGGGGQALERRHQVDAERDGGDRTTSTTCARTATSTSSAPAGSATTTTRRTSSTSTSAECRSTTRSG